MLIRTSVNLYPHNRAKAEQLAAQLGISFGKFFNLVMENLEVQAAETIKPVAKIVIGRGDKAAKHSTPADEAIINRA